MHKSQEAGKGTGKWTGEGEKPPLPTPHHFVLISTLLIIGFKIKNGHCRKYRELFRPKNTPVYSRQSHDLWPPLTWSLPSSPPYYLVSPIFLYFQKQRRRVKEKWKVFSPGKHAGMFSFARKTMLIFSTVTFVWLKNPLAFDYDTRKSLIAGVDKELQNVTKCHCAVEEEGKRQKRLSFLYNRSFKKSSWKKNKTRGRVIFFTLNGKMQRPKSKRV